MTNPDRHLPPIERGLATLVVIGVSTSSRADSTGGRGLALRPDEVVRARDRLRRDHRRLEHVVIATCDRTELVLADRGVLTPDTALTIWHEAIGVEFTGGRAPCLADSARPFVVTGREAVRHLCRVACGLESTVLGDSEVLSQLRRAFGDAERHGATGPITRQVFRDAFAVGRRARAKTEISAGGAGVGTAVSNVVGTPDHDIVIVGAGPAARTIARRLRKHSSAPITVANRTPSAALPFAREVDARVVDLDALDEVLLGAGTVVTATSAPWPIIDRRRLGRLRARRPDWSPRVIDVGAPPNVEPLLDLDVVGLDRLGERSAAVDSLRRTSISDVERLVDDTVERRYPPQIAPRPVRAVATTPTTPPSSAIRPIDDPSSPAPRSAVS